MTEAERGHPARDAGSDDAGQEYLVFALGDGRYALPMAPVDEILRVPALTPVPLSHEAVLGALNLRGRVVPVADLRHLLGHAAGEADEQARILVTEARSGLGLLVDAVLEATTIPDERVRPAANVTDLADLPWLDGVVECDQGLVQFVDLERLIDGAGLDAASPGRADTAGAMAVPQAGDARDAQTTEARHELLGVQVGEQLFALPLDNVVEILHEPESTSPLPDADESLTGVMDWRGRAVPLVDLAAHFDLARAGADGRRVLMVPLQGDRTAVDGPLVGLIADSVREVLRVPERQVDSLPELLRQGRQMDECRAVARLDDGRLVSVLDANRLVTADAVHRANEADASEDRAEAADVDTEQFVLFELAGSAYGVPIQAVKEIIRPPEHLTRVPRAPALVDGALNLRGSILPVIGLRGHLGLGPVADSEASRVVVLRRDAAWLGFGVDAVLRVERFPRDALRPAPESATRHVDLLTRVATDEDGRMTLLLDPVGLAARVEAAAEEMAMEDGETA